MSATAQLQTLLEVEGQHDTATLYALFDSLPAVAVESLRGDWSGGLLATGNPGEGKLAALRWVGKRFNTPDDVEPIVVDGGEGARVASDVMGKACLREVAHRGVLSAAMIYDQHPIIDYFRKFDDDTLLGVMDYKGVPQPLFFYLRREPG